MENQWRVSNEREHPGFIEPVQQSFLFVDADQQKTSRQGRRNARSFVMQKARKERPWSTSKLATKQKAQGKTCSRDATILEASSTLSTTSSSLVIPARAGRASTTNQTSCRTFGQNMCPECGSFLCQRNGQVYCLLCRPIPARNPNSPFCDPFQASSVPLNGSVLSLINHFHQNMAPGIIAVDFRNRSTLTLMNSDWVNTAICNAAFMHSFLCTTALHLYITGQGTSDAIIHHRDEAVSAVRATLANADSLTHISDANIGAVFNLLTITESLDSLPHFEHLRESEEQPNQRAMHLDGLRKMVQMRGGLNSIKSNRILQAFILWHSTAHAIAAFESPDPSTLDSITTASFPRHPTDYKSNASQHLVDCCHYAGINESLIELVESLLALIADLNAWFDESDDQLDALDIQNFSCVLECLLLTWLRDNEYTATSLETALCVALLIFTVRTTEAIKCRSDVHSLHFAASLRLKRALRCCTRSEWQAFPDLLLWILAVGAISAEGSVEGPWFVHQLSLACTEFYIYSVDGLLDRLQACGWVNFKLDEAVFSLWDNIADPCSEVHSQLVPIYSLTYT